MNATPPHPTADRTAEGFALELSRWYDAPCEAVFEAFTKPALLRQWWGPRGFVIEEIDFPARAGATYRVALRDPDGRRHVHVGSFLEVTPPSRLRYSWDWVEGPLAPIESQVELRFEAEGAGTRVELVHSRFPTPALRDAHSGWADSFARLAGWLAEREAG